MARSGRCDSSVRRRTHQLGLLVCIAVILAGCGGGGSGSGGDALGTKGSSTTGLTGSAPGSGGTGGSGTADAGADTDPTQAVQVGQGGNSACALTKGGRVRCWGYSESLGILSPSDPPKELPGISGATAISVTSGSVCAIVKAGAVKCMGSGGVGQLGDGKKESTSYPYKPVDAAGIKGATQISSYSSYQCAVLDNGEVKCWGSLPYGPGTDKFESTRPETVPGLKGATQVSVGEHGDRQRTTGVAVGQDEQLDHALELRRRVVEHALELGEHGIELRRVEPPVLGEMRERGVGHAAKPLMVVDLGGACWAPLVTSGSLQR